MQAPRSFSLDVIDNFGPEIEIVAIFPKGLYNITLMAGELELVPRCHMHGSGAAEMTGLQVLILIGCHDRRQGRNITVPVYPRKAPVPTCSCHTLVSGSVNRVHGPSGALSDQRNVV